MEKINVLDINEYCSGKLLINGNDTLVDNISIDSREVSSSSLFVPIKGERFDGHDFMEEVYNKGCRNFLCDNNHSFFKEDINLIKVENTTLAFGLISKGYKNNFSIPVISVTGSVGKTSTKDIIYSVLKEKYNTLKTEGNLNNEIGVPKTLFRIDSLTEMAIVEMGMDKKGEIDYLTNLVNPNIAVITNIGMSHIMNFDNQDGIFNAKMEIVNGFTDKGLLIVNGDDKYLKTVKSCDKYDVISYGFDKENDIYCKDYVLGNEVSNFTCVYEDKEYSFKIKSFAKHNVGNALIAIVLGFRFGLSVLEIEKGLMSLEFSQNRLEIINTDEYTIINDTYNASYDSVMSALGILNNFKGRKVAILGDIFELGSYSEEIHRKIGKNIECDLLIAIGDNAKYIYEEALNKGISTKFFKDKEDFYKEYKNIIEEIDVILIKASRGMYFDEITDKLKN